MAGGQALLQAFFVPDDADVEPAAADGGGGGAATSSPRLRKSMKRSESVRLPSDPKDPDASLQAVLRLLPKVNCDILAAYADGIARSGWVYKEGQHYGSGWQVCVCAHNVHSERM